MHFFVSKHFLVSLPVPWPVQKQGCFMPENIPGHFGHTGKDIGFRPVYAYRTGTKKRCFFLKVMNSVPFQLEQTENLVPVYKPEWGTPCSTSEKISAYSGAFRAFRSILANSGRNQRFGGHGLWVFFFLLKEKSLPLDLLYRRWKKKKKKERDEGMQQSPCERENTKEEEEEEKKDEKRDWREHLWAIEVWRLRRRWNFVNEKRKKEWSGEMRSKYCRPREWVGEWEKLVEGNFLEVPPI